MLASLRRIAETPETHGDASAKEEGGWLQAGGFANVNQCVLQLAIGGKHVRGPEVGCCVPPRQHKGSTRDRDRRWPIRELRNGSVKGGLTARGIEPYRSIRRQLQEGEALIRRNLFHLEAYQKRFRESHVQVGPRRPALNSLGQVILCTTDRLRRVAL